MKKCSSSKNEPLYLIIFMKLISFEGSFGCSGQSDWTYLPSAALPFVVSQTAAAERSAGCWYGSRGSISAAKSHHLLPFGSLYAAEALQDYSSSH